MSNDIVILDNRPGAMAPTAVVSANSPHPQANPVHVYLANFGSQHSVVNVKSRLDGFARFYGFEDSYQYDWSRIDYTSVIAYRLYLVNKEKEADPRHRLKKAKGMEASSIKAIMSALRGIAKVACNLHLLPFEELRSIENIKPLRSHRTPAGRQLTKTESQILFEVIDTTSPKGLRDKAILGLMLGCGLRRDEITGLLLENVNWEIGSLKLIGKGDKERKVFFTPIVREYLENWLEYRGMSDGYIFGRFWKNSKGVDIRKPLSDSGVSKIVQERWEAAAAEITEGSEDKSVQPPKVRPHDFRRTFATRLFAKNVDIVMVKELMGHVNVTTTANYDRRGEDDVKRAAQAMEL